MLSEKVLSKICEKGILLFGCGGKMGHYYMEKLKNLGVNEAYIIGIDINSENLEKIRTKYPSAYYYSDWDGHITPACAIIAVNSTAHLPVIKECYAKKIEKIFIEKPLVYYQSELDELRKFDNSNLYVAHLINFSGIVKNLIEYAQRKNLVMVQAFSKWGKNWPGEKRIMGGDAEEELPHPLALILALANAINGDITIKDIVSHTSMIPHVQPEYLEGAKDLELDFPDKMNDSTLLGFNILTQSGSIPVHLSTSFNYCKQNRLVEISFRRADSESLIPTEKAYLEFDVNPFKEIFESLCYSTPIPLVKIEEEVRSFLNDGYADLLSGNRDRLLIIDAISNQTVLTNEYKGDKIQANLQAALEVLLGNGIDFRLTDFNQAKYLTSLIQKIIG
ncbi:MAG: hypothetical protein US83_C0015G0013 [Candidatus Falkowbacteria bacterium GW2011_GWC2_38_22]|nr:MAG: hypothetical protein US73_C0013G0013 [Candidatus Falkowbacteria bacterium GW2011_GWF2_38_1205]KKQ60605.1 MAG: hypothetical protein US83_C0015G0013 [Candidatus Falkowbacteria bacterium GW2011_GWC2_38_22]KKQ62696.1 MAG: hypothetical protein US84_C0012G0013 [Candidatus Falkowbacteria bacterium GW2011_GWF1_38_22]KKQ64823.1 MAG: hypothetical protein US87_C0012G0013 [Candidatus Falkowbacteria bacterium GW2011_GWE2_38_254]KKQ72065.1 MAG: hypothetical protein US93_C0012G0013 [Candidatus Falkowb